jgi:hypothetical protein
MTTGDLILKPDHFGEPNAPPEWRYYEVCMKIRAQMKVQQRLIDQLVRRTNLLAQQHLRG